MFCQREKKKIIENKHLIIECVEKKAYQLRNRRLLRSLVRVCSKNIFTVLVHDKVAVFLEDGLALAVGRNERLANVQDGAGTEEVFRGHLFFACFCF